jgi:hypothetical protein
MFCMEMDTQILLVARMGRRRICYVKCRKRVFASGNRTNQIPFIRRKRNKGLLESTVADMNIHLYQ